MKLVGVLRLNLASSSLQTATLRLTPSDHGGIPNAELAAASEPLASSWQRSTKLPRRTASLSRSGWSRGGWAGPYRPWKPADRTASRGALHRAAGGGVCRGRLPYNEAEDPVAPAGRKRSERKLSLTWEWRLQRQEVTSAGVLTGLMRQCR